MWAVYAESAGGRRCIEPNVRDDSLGGRVAGKHGLTAAPVRLLRNLPEDEIADIYG
jgi:hypothetical protein